MENISTDHASAVFSDAVHRDFGCPMWSLHFFPFAVLDEHHALFIGSDDGHDSLYSVDLKTPGLPTKLNTGCVVIDSLRSLGNGSDEKIVFAGTKVDEETNIVNFIIPGSCDGSLRAFVTNFESVAKETQSVSEWISIPTRYAIQGYYRPCMLYIMRPRIQTVRARLKKSLLALYTRMVVQSDCNPKDWAGRNNTSHRTDGHGKLPVFPLQVVPN